MLVSIVHVVTESEKPLDNKLLVASDKNKVIFTHMATLLGSVKLGNTNSYYFLG